MTSQIDNLSKVPRLLVWAGISLVAVLVITLAGLPFGDPTFGWSEGGLFVILMTAGAYVGSEYRNRKRQPGETFGGSAP